MVKFVLASGSPRRKELLEQIGLSFEIASAHGEEIITKQKPADIVEELSLQKAGEVADRYEKEHGRQKSTVIIGADTIVAYDGAIMGKPKDKADAVRMLSSLQGKVHQVYTGVCLIYVEGRAKTSSSFFEQGRRVISFHEKTDVEMYPMTGEQIQTYVETGEPVDKAGAYAIQGRCAAYIKEICGEYNNVVGLPVGRLVWELDKAGIKY